MPGHIPLFLREEYFSDLLILSLSSSTPHPFCDPILSFHISLTCPPPSSHFSLPPPLSVLEPPGCNLRNWFPFYFYLTSENLLPSSTKPYFIEATKTATPDANPHPLSSSKVKTITKQGLTGNSQGQRLFPMDKTSRWPLISNLSQMQYMGSTQHKTHSASFVITP